jgi:hypothetical protein
MCSRSGPRVTGLDARDRLRAVGTPEPTREVVVYE